MTSVICVKINNLRQLGYGNLKDWMDNPNNVYIGRKGIVFINGERYPKSDSIWANPFKINKDGDRDIVISKYRDYIIDKINKNVIKKEQLIELRGKTLGCWCKPDKCHGDILIELINNVKN